MMRKVNPLIDRRQFLAQAALAGVFTIVPRRVLGGAGYISPARRFRLPVSASAVSATGRSKAWPSRRAHASWPCATWMTFTLLRRIRSSRRPELIVTSA